MLKYPPLDTNPNVKAYSPEAKPSIKVLVRLRDGALSTGVYLFGVESWSVQGQCSDAKVAEWWSMPVIGSGTLLPEGQMRHGTSDWDVVVNVATRGGMQVACNDSVVFGASATELRILRNHCAESRLSRVALLQKAVEDFEETGLPESMRPVIARFKEGRGSHMSWHFHGSQAETVFVSKTESVCVNAVAKAQGLSVSKMLTMAREEAWGDDTGE